MEDIVERPFKVWSSDRKTRKAIVAKSLNELILKGKKKLGYTDEKVVVYLEDDGTIVEDEDYFDTLDDHATLLLVKEDESYSKPWEYGEDQTDGGSSTHSALYEITGRLRYDLAKLITLSQEELQIVANAEENELCSLLNCSKQETEELQEACQRYLDQMRDIDEATEAVHLIKEHYVRSSEQSQGVKRKKAEAK